ncbi:Tripartite-type tricarboxylate transporter, receptor component TctC [Noviherbaspirillum humi]|uniref:Tripartite-type tricarboxylate transporter, receptor component TctC n=1 Tax=Noviherbaspirillum humi TaxID=1688639 RepID=A0A239ETR1_9BURK|nr:tripartite tricarboxylate transporter substrate binding protein [Noviherbaspirillum humi]SNS47801.1 Tripartite-type tricarboxylate transporter, receptor component TctC [Noviherbaspirillum humi]
MKFRRFAAVAAMAFATLGPAQAQNYPTKPITIIVPFTPGGTTDILARLVGAELSKNWGQPVIVENRPGAAGNTGGAIAAKAAPDGYTMFMGTVGTHAINPALYAKMPYDHLRDFTPISLVASVPNVLAINSGFAEKNRIGDVPALISYMRAHPGEINFASSGAGTSIHLSGELFKAKTHTQMVHVPYKGSAPAVSDLVGGQVQIMFDNLPSSIGHIKTGKLKALAVTTTKPVPALPGVPTVASYGGELADFEAGSWFGLFVPAATPAPVVNKLSNEVAKIVALPEIREKILGQGAEPVGSKSDEFASYIRSETKKWAEVVKVSGARAE